MDRHFRHLTQTEISDIVASHLSGEQPTAIAQRYDIHHSTVLYHVRKYEKAYPEEGGVYALIKTNVRKVCLHPSGRCTLCGEMWDELKRSERERIEALERKLKAAQDTLRTAGYQLAE